MTSWFLEKQFIGILQWQIRLDNLVRRAVFFLPNSNIEAPKNSCNIYRELGGDNGARPYET